MGRSPRGDCSSSCPSSRLGPRSQRDWSLPRFRRRPALLHRWAITPARQHGLVLALVAAAGALLFLLRLGATGLVDETPPLFAAAARAMAERGDWLIPQVNGLPRYDKPPLIYWLMGLVYALPGQAIWNPLGTWAARLPSALATIAVMLTLADTLLRWPQAQRPLGRLAAPAMGASPVSPISTDSPALQSPGGLADQSPATTLANSIAAPTAALAFALGPLVLVWGRIAVSDALFSGLLALSLLLAWRTYAASRGPWWPTWLLLALAVLTKGPVALVLVGLTLLLFALVQQDGSRLRRRLKPLRGLLLALLLAAPWYGLALLREGGAFWRSFFGYHNAQRFIQVVNNHHQGWWYFGAVLLVASLPYTPLLLLGLFEGLSPLLGRLLPRGWPQALAGAAPCSKPLPPPVPRLDPADSLQRFAACWLLAVLLFFSVAATKLPSYWLPATPAAALLVALTVSAAGDRARPGLGRELWVRPSRWLRLAFASSVLLLLTIAAALAAAPLWGARIQDPAMPGLQAALASGPWFAVGAALALLAALLGAGAMASSLSWRLLQSQLVLMLFMPLVLLPLWQVVDQLRGAPVRDLAAVVVEQGDRQQQPLAMVGLLKPSLHYYSRRTVLYEGRSPAALVNLVDRLEHESRPGLQPSLPQQQPQLLLVIDAETARRPHWQGLGGQLLAIAEPYRLLRLDRQRLEQRSRQLQAGGLKPTWRQPRPERY